METYTHTKHCTQMFMEARLKRPGAGNGPDVLPQMDAQTRCHAHPSQKTNTIRQLERAPTDACSHLESSSENQVEWKHALPNGDTVDDFIYIIFWNDNISEMENRWADDRSQGEEGLRTAESLQNCNTWTFAGIELFCIITVVVDTWTYRW